MSIINNKSQLILKTNAIYEEPSIFIDDTNPTYNWSATALAGYPWFSGSGTKNDPYEIDNVRVTTGDIIIRNSFVSYFRVRNCEGHIYLHDVLKGQLDNNNCSDIFDYGIELRNCNDSLITGNTIIGNHEGGLYMFDSHNNTIYGNIVNRNWWPNHGISLDFDCTENKVENNEVNFHDYHGINVHGFNNTIKGNNVKQNSLGIYVTGMYNNIVGNTAFNNSDSGIFLSWADYSNVSGNFINFNEEFGIRLRYGSHIKVTNNTGYNNGFSGVLFEDVLDITASGNSMYGCGYFFAAITSSSLSSLEIDTSNLVNGKPFYYYFNQQSLKPLDFDNAGQVMMLNCSNSMISNIDVSNGTIGLWLINSINNTIENVESSDNIIFGIFLSSSKNNTVIECTTNYNGNGGIYLQNSHNCTISANEANYNSLFLSSWFTGLGNGLSLTGSHNSTISGNIANNNTVNGIYVNFGDENIISGNIADSNGGNGIYIEGGDTGWEIKYCIFNKILENDVFNNGNYGIHLEYCMSHFVEENTAQFHHTQENGGYSVDQYGILLENSHFCNISENEVAENEVGIVLSRSTENLLYRNHLVADLSANILLSWSHNNTLLENLIESVTPWSGIELDNSHDNIIEKNELINGGTALWLQESDYNIIIENYFHDLTATAVVLSESSYNVISNNTIRNCYRCFSEGDDCIGNVFENNICEGEGYHPPIVFGFNVLIVVLILIFVVTIFSVIKVPKRMKLR